MCHTRFLVQPAAARCQLPPDATRCASPAVSWLTRAVVSTIAVRGGGVIPRWWYVGGIGVVPGALITRAGRVARRPYGQSRMPRALALATAWVRLVTPSFP